MDLWTCGLVDLWTCGFTYVLLQDLTPWSLREMCINETSQAWSGSIVTCPADRLAITSQLGLLSNWSLAQLELRRLADQLPKSCV